ncbi:MAG TPA: DUF6174 domain-containing protein [Candidatus Limnocylindria bacterium]|nr:DUF6174 domain-containing protein [Candidatus Limnocylindria bacterium]
MVDVAETPQLSTSRTFLAGRVSTGWLRLLAVGGVTAAALVAGMLIGCSRGFVVGDDPSGPGAISESTPPPTASPGGTVWAEPAAYVFVFRADCGERSLIGTFSVTVEDGSAIAWRPLDERASAYPGGLEDMPTLGELTRTAEEAHADARAVVELETDLADGHPTLISIDWKPNTIDDEECYRITHYEPYPLLSASPVPSAASVWSEPASYVYTFDSQCGLRILNGRYEVTVREGRVVGYRSLDAPDSHYVPDDQIPTLGELLDLAERARADPDAVVRAFEVDPRDGHPSRIDIDWLPNAIDDEECYVIESYTPGE